MKRSQSRFSSFLAELFAARSSSFAKFSGATIPRRKPPGSESKTYGNTTHTYFLASPNLEGEIHLKGGRFVTSQFSIWMLYIDHHMHIIFLLHFVVILEILSNSRTQGESWRFHKFSYLNLIQIWKEDQFDFYFFSTISSNNKNKWEKIIWVLQQREILEKKF